MPYRLDFEQREGYIYVTVTGDNSTETVASYLLELNKICQDNQCQNVLIVENLEGQTLSTLDIYDLVSRRSRPAAQVIGRIAYVDINREHDKKAMEFAETVAVNRGLQVRLFASVAEAEAWMRIMGEAAA